jgi:hypothetical protein
MVPVAAVAAVVVVAIGAYVLMSATGSSGRLTQAAAAATVSVEARHAVALLEQERQQMIAIDEASRSTHVLAAPKLASTAAPVAPRSTAAPVAPTGTSAPPTASSVPPLGPVDPGTARADAENLLPSFGWSVTKYFGCLDNIWSRESGWRYNAANPSGAYGIPQALPGAKMASAGADWQTNPITQIKWGLGYIEARYGDPCSAWSYWQANGSY